MFYIKTCLNWNFCNQHSVIVIFTVNDAFNTITLYRETWENRYTKWRKKTRFGKFLAMYNFDGGGNNFEDFCKIHS